MYKKLYNRTMDKKAESGQKVSLEDEICADNIPVHKNEKKVLLLFNKPRGIVCSTKQQFDETTVTDYLDYPLRVSASRLEHMPASLKYLFILIFSSIVLLYIFSHVFATGYFSCIFLLIIV